MKLAYILSLPRSGSTVLSAMLDRRKGIVSPPESSFPQMLGVLTSKEREDPRWMAALYHGCTFTPTPLSLEDAEACMEGSNKEILVKLGLAVASKLGRSSSEVKAVVWKTPRMIGLHDGPLSTNGQFIVLRRNPHNVYESQFRVGFGEKNRNPYRFAVFRESYENAFARLPDDRIMEIAYDDLPEAVDCIARSLGVDDSGEWESKAGSLDMAATTLGHMAEVTQKFRNRDPEKRERLKSGQVRTLDRAMVVARPLRAFLGPVRAYYDMRSTAWSKNKAAEILRKIDDND